MTKCIIIIFRLTTHTIHLSMVSEGYRVSFVIYRDAHDGHGCSKLGRVRQSGMGHLVNSDRRPSAV